MSVLSLLQRQPQTPGEEGCQIPSRRLLLIGASTRTDTSSRHNETASGCYVSVALRTVGHSVHNRAQFRLRQSAQVLHDYQFSQQVLPHYFPLDIRLNLSKTVSVVQMRYERFTSF